VDVPPPMTAPVGGPPMEPPLGPIGVDVGCKYASICSKMKMKREKHRRTTKEEDMTRNLTLARCPAFSIPIDLSMSWFNR